MVPFKDSFRQISEGSRAKVCHEGSPTSHRNRPVLVLLPFLQHCMRTAVGSGGMQKATSWGCQGCCSHEELERQSFIANSPNHQWRTEQVRFTFFKELTVKWEETEENQNV